MDDKKRFRKEFPYTYFLDLGDLKRLHEYLVAGGR